MWLRLSEDLLRHVLDFVAFPYQVASCSECRTVTLWGPRGPRLELRGHTAEVLGIRFFPLGDRALTWSEDGRAIVWDTASGAPLRALEHDGPVFMAGVFPGGDRVATCAAGGCAIWALRAGAADEPEPMRLPGSIGARALEVFPAGDRLLAWGTWAWATVWNASSGDEVYQLVGHQSEVSVAAVLPAGDKVVTGSAGEGLAIIWDAASGLMLSRLLHFLGVSGIAVLGCGRTVATTGASSTAVWDVDRGERTLTIAQDALWPLWTLYGAESFARRPDRLATFTLQAALIWDIPSGRLLRRLSSVPDAYTYGVASAPEGDVLVACSGDGVIIWDTASGARRTFEAPSGARQHGDRATSCFVALGLGRAFDTDGFGRGASRRDLP